MKVGEMTARRDLKLLEESKL
ncbi:MAG: hypothetical protein KJ593_00395 [Candidatus Omnitrophica bacterium]|nr:hypothetical protein [Candidatus Omnitrophota bacterium]